MSNSGKARLVLNHSTHIPGLINILHKLCDRAEIKTITPGVIGRAKAHSPHMKLKISVPIMGGFKLIARQGKTFQEVFIITNLNQRDLEEAIGEILKTK